MNYESRTYIQHYGDDLDRVSAVLGAFGWKGEDKRIIVSPSSSNTQITFVRDRDMPNYEKLASLQNDYESVEKSRENEPEYDPTILVVAFLIVVIPGLIYILYKQIQRKKVKERNESREKIMQDILNQAQPLSEGG